MPARFSWLQRIGTKTRIFGLGLVLAALGGCGGSTSVDEDLYVSLGSAGATSRPFLMSSTPVQMLPVEGRAFMNGNDNYKIKSLADDMDIVTIVPEYYGIPYDVFALGPTIPDTHPWAREMTELVRQAKASGRPLLLYLAFARKSMVGAAVDVAGSLEVDITWAPVCYDFAQPAAAAIGDAYVNYVKWMTSRFKPMYVVNFVEANIYYGECGGASDSWDELVKIQRRAYDAIKAEKSDVDVLVAFHLETLYGHKLNGWKEKHYQDVTKMKFDIFGMATYPFGERFADGTFVTPYDLPSDYLTRVRSRHPEVTRLALSETGWNNAAISVGDDTECFNNFPYSERSFAESYLEFVLQSARGGQFELVTWFSFRDSIPESVVTTCYVDDSSDPALCLGDFWCSAVNYSKQNVSIPGEPPLFSEVVLKSFGSMGLREYSGKPRNELLNRWRYELALPLGIE